MAVENIRASIAMDVLLTSFGEYQKNSANFTVRIGDQSETYLVNVEVAEIAGEELRVITLSEEFHLQISHNASITIRMYEIARDMYNGHQINLPLILGSI